MRIKTRIKTLTFVANSNNLHSLFNLRLIRSLCVLATREFQLFICITQINYQEEGQFQVLGSQLQQAN
jgi:hypothetical protein